MNPNTLLADPESLEIEKFISEENSITIVARSILSTASCPHCHQFSGSLKTRYFRQVADLPWHGVKIKLLLRVRKFRCRNNLCIRKVFCERLPKVVDKYARRTTRLGEVIAFLAFALGGRNGAKASAKLNIAVSRDTLLCTIRRQPKSVTDTVKVLGVDDFAFRKGQSYGTILVDLEKRQPIDLLSDRESETLALWLKQHPEIEIISRDRGSNYIEGSNKGAPQAKQVADRWHLLKNATEVFEKTICRNYAKLRQVLFPKDADIFFSEEEITIQIKAGEEAKTKVLQEAQNKTKELTPFYLEKLKVFEMVKHLQAKGLTINQIRIQINRHFSMVARCYRVEEFQKIKRDTGSRLLKPFVKYLKQRWDEGCQNAKQLYREIKEQGYRGSDVTVRRLTYQWKPSTIQNIQFIKNAPPKLPSVKQMVWILLKAGERLSEEEKELRQKVLANSNEIKQGLGLLNKFRAMVREKKSGNYEEWLKEAENKALKEYENFAKGLKRDNEAVKNALSEKWSNGQVEGQVNRLKFIKRQMYGRANFDLLKARVLHQF